MTNREKINNMSNEELANFIFNTTSYCGMCNNSKFSERFETYICKDLSADCCEHIQQWLTQEVEE